MATVFLLMYAMLSFLSRAHIFWSDSTSTLSKWTTCCDTVGTTTSDPCTANCFYFTANAALYRTTATNTIGYNNIYLEIALLNAINNAMEGTDACIIQYNTDSQTSTWNQLGSYTSQQLPTGLISLPLPSDADNNIGIRIRFTLTGTSGSDFCMIQTVALKGVLCDTNGCTSTPTTYNPTTFVPTTSNPTTLIPTTNSPTTNNPSVTPSNNPTLNPTLNPSYNPSSNPTVNPSNNPTTATLTTPIATITTERLTATPTTSITNEMEKKSQKEETHNSNFVVIVSVIGGISLLFCCIGILIVIIVIQRRKLKKMHSVQSLSTNNPYEPPNLGIPVSHHDTNNYDEIQPGSMTEMIIQNLPQIPDVVVTNDGSYNDDEYSTDSDTNSLGNENVSTMGETNGNQQ